MDGGSDSEVRDVDLGTGDVGSEILALVARRRALLERLAAEPVRTGDLAATFDVSRSTIGRAVDELLEASLVERHDGAYRIALPGLLALEEFDRVAAGIATVVEASEILAALPADPALDPAFFPGATVVDGRNGDRPTEAFETLVASATRHRVSLPADLASLVDAYGDAVAAGLECDLTVTTGALERIVRTRGDLLADLHEADRVALREVSGGDATEYGLVVSEGESRVACVIVPGADAPEALVLADRPRAVACAEDRLAEIEAAATPLPPAPD